MALKAMLERIAGGEELKFEYIGSDAENGTLLVGTDIKSGPRLEAKQKANITSDGKIAKGNCTLKDGIYHFACISVKPKKDHVKAAIKRSWTGFSAQVKVVGPDGKDDEEETTGGSVQTPTGTTPKTTPQQGVTPSTTGTLRPTPPIRTPPQRPPTETSPTPKTGGTTPTVDPKLGEARQKVTVILQKIEQALPLLATEFARELELLRSTLQLASRETTASKVEIAYEDGVNKFRDIVARAKEAKEQAERDLQKAKETATALVERINSTILPQFSGTKAIQITQLRDTLTRISTGTDTTAIQNLCRESVTKIKEIANAPSTPPPTGTGPSRTPPPRPTGEQSERPTTGTGPTRTPPPTPTRDLAVEDRVLAQETLNLINGLDLPEAASIQPFVDVFNSFSRTYNTINGVTDPTQKLEQRKALRDKIVLFKEQVRAYVPPRTEVNQALNECKVFFRTPRKGILVNTYNKLIDDLDVHDNLTDTAVCVTSIEGLRRAFVAFNGDKEKLDQDYEKTVVLYREIGPMIPQRSKEFIDRINSAGTPQELRTLMSELQKIKNEGPEKARIATETVTNTAPNVLKALPAAKRIELITDLRRGPETTKDVRQKALAKLYKCMELEPEFNEKDKEMRNRVLANLKENPILKEAKNTWNTKNTEQKVGVLKEALKIQCREMGIPEEEMPPIQLFSQPSEQVTPNKKLTCEGFFSPKDGKIYINDERASFGDDFDDSLDTIIHENTHNYQHKLVQKLEKGEIKKGDVEYNQAVLFQLNFNGYLNSEDEGTEAYEKQPVEMHAWQSGTEAHKLFVEDAKAAGGILLGKIKALVKNFPTFASQLQVVQRELETALDGKKSGAIEKATEESRVKVLRIADQIKKSQGK